RQLDEVLGAGGGHRRADQSPEVTARLFCHARELGGLQKELVHDNPEVQDLADALPDLDAFCLPAVRDARRRERRDVGALPDVGVNLLELLLRERAASVGRAARLGALATCGQTTDGSDGSYGQDNFLDHITHWVFPSS